MDTDGTPKRQENVMKMKKAKQIFAAMRKLSLFLSSPVMSVAMERSRQYNYSIQEMVLKGSVFPS